MSHSLNEIELLARHAARGAGYCWGLSEEAAGATRWLCAHDLDGIGELARLLQRGLAGNIGDHRPEQPEGIWQGKAILCPVITGCLLSDCAFMLREGPVHIRVLASPMLLLPFGANVARTLGICVTVTCNGLLTITDGVELSAPDGFPGQVKNVEVRTGGFLSRRRPRCNRAHPHSRSRELLQHLAHKTYAPATAESRLLGAGAGLSEND